ncbi:hypothetical protein [Xanthobacter autotrophicus]|uniref:hypothetical protein n=1 Tax=Xanthobacter autotrophicus TaxID=280 RepID=UPI003729BAEB
MPIIPWPEDSGLRTPEPYRPEPERPEPTLGQVAGAAFRADNDVVNAADWLTRPTFQPQDGYDVFHDPAFKGSVYQQQFDRSFWNSRSEAETQAIISRIDREQEDRRTLDAAGAGGVIMGLAAGIASPTTLLPGGALVRGARGLSALRSALSVGTAAAGAVAAQEAVLQGTQETRTLGESAINVASGAILGGLLGAGGAALLGRAERRMLERGMDEARLPFGERDAPLPNPAANLVRDDVLAKLGAAGVPEEEAAANAVLWQARYDARARRLGLDPAQAFDLYQKEGVDIRAAEAPDVLGPDSLPQSWLDRLKSAGASSEVKAPAPAAATPARGPARVDTTKGEWTLYHGTYAADDFARFEPELAVNQKHSTPDEMGLFLAPSPAMANAYTGAAPNADAGAGPRVFKVKVDPGRFKVLDIPEMIRSDPEFVDLLHDTNGRRQGRGVAGTGRTADDFAALSRDRLAEVVGRTDADAARMRQAAMQDAPDLAESMVEEARRVPVSTGAVSAAVRYGKAKGYDTIVIRGLAEHGGGDQVVVLRPDRVFSAYTGDKLYQSGTPARWKEIPVGDDLVARGSVRRGAGGSDVVAFDLFRRPSDGAGLPDGVKGALGQVELLRRNDGRWEVDWSRVPESERGKGYASRLYDVVEKELGANMVPSGLLLPDGHAFWQARNPDLVQWHRKVGKAWYSPRRMEEELAGLRAQEAADPGSTGTRIQAFEKALDSVPAEGKTPEATARMFQDGNAPRGAITMADNRALIELFQGRDASTFMHESGHLWLTEMVRDAEVSPAVKADLDATLRWLGVDDAAKIGVEHQEKWARGFEQYLRDGKAPTTALARVFEQFKDWLTAIYRAVSDLGDELPEEIRGVMDRMLAAPEGEGAIGARQVRFSDEPPASASSRIPDATEPTTSTRSPSPAQLAALAPELTPAKLLAARSSEETEAAVLHDLDKLRASRDLQVPIGERLDETGQRVADMRSVDDLMDEADARLAAAAEIRACAMPMPEVTP